LDLETTLPLSHDDIDERGFLKCLARAGTGLLPTVRGGMGPSFDLSGISRGRLAIDDARATLAADRGVTRGR